MHKSVHTLIGETPLFELTHKSIPTDIRVIAKLEYMNPGGSIKDRLGMSLLKHAIEQKYITHNGTIIEPTAGNTWIALALAAIGTNVKVHCVIPKGFSREKQQLMQALGATVHITPNEKGIEGAIAYAKELTDNITDSYSPCQFNNEQNPLTYYETLAPELWSQLGGNIDVFVAGAGTGGTFTGTARYLKEKNAAIRTVVVEPEGSILNGGTPGPHRTEGIGMNQLSTIIDPHFFDGIHTITDCEAFHMTRQLARNVGLLVGSSSGAAFCAALREAQKAKKGDTIVTIFPDGSERYLSTEIYEEEK